MLERLIFWQLGREERRLGPGACDYLRHLWRTSRPSFWAFARGRQFLQHHRLVPRDVYHIARVVATQVEDCGPCVQIAVNLAVADGVGTGILERAVTRRFEELPEELTAVAHFAEAVARGDTAAVEQWRPRVQARYGEGALGELALTIATARVFPTVKRAMGFATSCALVEIQVGGQV